MNADPANVTTFQLENIGPSLSGPRSEPVSHLFAGPSGRTRMMGLVPDQTENTGSSSSDNGISIFQILHFKSTNGQSSESENDEYNCRGMISALRI